MSPIVRRSSARAAAVGLLALTVLGGCAQEEPTLDPTGTSTGASPDAGVRATDAAADDAVTTTTAPSSGDDAATTSQGAPSTTDGEDDGTADAAPTTGPTPTGDGAGTPPPTADPLSVTAEDGAFEVDLPAGWVDARDDVDVPGVQVAGRAPEQVDGFFTNLLVTEEEDVSNLSDAVERAARELAGEDGEYELLEPVEVDGDRAPGYTIIRDVSGRTLHQTQRWISHDDTLYVVTLTAEQSQAEEAAPLLDELLESWSWTE